MVESRESENNDRPGFPGQVIDRPGFPERVIDRQASRGDINDPSGFPW